MSLDADVLMVEWEHVVDNIVELGCDDRSVVEDVLKECGEKIHDKYVILVDEHVEYDAMHVLCATIEHLFDVDDCFGAIYDIGLTYIGGVYSDKGRIDKQMMDGFIRRLTTD